MQYPTQCPHWINKTEKKRLLFSWAGTFGCKSSTKEACRSLPSHPLVVDDMGHLLDSLCESSEARRCIPIIVQGKSHFDVGPHAPAPATVEQTIYDGWCA